MLTETERTILTDVQLIQQTIALLVQAGSTAQGLDAQSKVLRTLMEKGKGARDDLLNAFGDGPENVSEAAGRSSAGPTHVV
jgi:hypothetical protein